MSIGELRMLRIEEVLELTGIKSRSTIWQLAKDGDFPRAYRVGKRGTAWRLSEVRTWLEERVCV